MSDNDERPKLQLVKVEPVPEDTDYFDIEFKDIENLDIEKLREMRIKSSYVLSAFAFREAGVEYSHLNSLRGMLSRFEKDLSDQNTVTKMSLTQKILTFRSLADHYKNCRGFVGDLSKDTNAGVDQLALIEKMKNRQEVRSGTTKDPEITELKAALLAQMRKRSAAK